MGITTAGSTTTAKVVGSLGVLAAAAAVAGMGTFGGFSDSTTPVSVPVATGTINIDATTTATVPVDASGLVPGASVSRAVTLANTGSLDLGALSMTIGATGSGVLTGPGGLQLTVTSCPVAWTAANSCAGTPTVVRTGGLTGQVPLAASSAMKAGQADHFLLTVSLPGTAGNQFQGQQSMVSLQFDAVQKTGTAR
ncbi:TasA family protein [Blastococcus sp. HT6-4]|uniref:TasA family protein n=1 Tax=Blastococcus montanus TaxID=3144973 RepID=UPI0032090E31